MAVKHPPISSKKGSNPVQTGWKIEKLFSYGRQGQYTWKWTGCSVTQLLYSVMAMQHPESVMALLRSTEQHLVKDPELAKVYNQEIYKQHCSFQRQQASLNDQLPAEPTLGPPLIGVLLCFREYPVAVISDISI